MFMQELDDYLGCGNTFKELRALSDKLNAEVIDQVNESQELLMLNQFAHEANEMQFRKSLQERISDIASWRWVLQDLSKRLYDLMGTLEYEQNAIRVVIERVNDELANHSREASRPGALEPFSDAVEDAIMQEHNFLRQQKKVFEGLICQVDKQIRSLTKVKKDIDQDTLKKKNTLHIEERCGGSLGNVNLSSTGSSEKSSGNAKKRKSCPVVDWENRCAMLKEAGLKTLNDALMTKQSIRGERMKLSISAQAYASKVDAALRRRLHSNKTKLQELSWQKDEAIRDLKTLDEELLNTEQNLLETMEQEKVVLDRISDRASRPSGELTKDDVDRKLRDELVRLRSFCKQLRDNIKGITSLMNNLHKAIMNINNCADDILQVACLDEDRVRARTGEVGNETGTTMSVPSTSDPPRTSNEADSKSASRVRRTNKSRKMSGPRRSSGCSSNTRSLNNRSLTIIKEESEEYPTDD